MNRLGTLLQLDNRTWSTVQYQELSGRVMTVLFAYGVLAWNRFGLLGLVAPRSMTRFVLIGIYSWLATAAVVWLAARAQPAGNSGILVRPRDAAVATAIVHVPLVSVAIFMAIIAGFARVLGPGTVLAILVVGLWMPALLVRAFHDVAGLAWVHAAPVALVVHALWVVTTGRYLHQQVGHLL